MVPTGQHPFVWNTCTRSDSPLQRTNSLRLQIPKDSMGIRCAYKDQLKTSLIPTLKS